MVLGTPKYNEIHAGLRYGPVVAEEPIFIQGETKERMTSTTPEKTPLPRTPEKTPLPRTPEKTPLPRTPEKTPLPRTPENTPLSRTPEKAIISQSGLKADDLPLEEAPMPSPFFYPTSPGESSRTRFAPIVPHKAYGQSRIDQLRLKYGRFPSFGTSVSKPSFVSRAPQHSRDEQLEIDTQPSYYDTLSSLLCDLPKVTEYEDESIPERESESNRLTEVSTFIFPSGVPDKAYSQRDFGEISSPRKPTTSPPSVSKVKPSKVRQEENKATYAEVAQRFQNFIPTSRRRSDSFNKSKDSKAQPDKGFDKMFQYTELGKEVDVETDDLWTPSEQWSPLPNLDGIDSSGTTVQNVGVGVEPGVTVPPLDQWANILPSIDGIDSSGTTVQNVGIGMEPGVTVPPLDQWANIFDSIDGIDSSGTTVQNVGVGMEPGVTVPPLDQWANILPSIDGIDSSGTTVQNVGVGMETDATVFPFEKWPSQPVGSDTADVIGTTTQQVGTQTDFSYLTPPQSTRQRKSSKDVFGEAGVGGGSPDVSTSKQRAKGASGSMWYLIWTQRPPNRGERAVYIHNCYQTL